MTSVSGLSSRTPSLPVAAVALQVLDGAFAVCRLPPESPLPDWAAASSFWSITQTHEELSVVCHEGCVPPGVPSESGWKCLRAEGKLDFTMVGVLASILAPLAAAGVSVFVVSTFDTDYLMIKEKTYETAIRELRNAGHTVNG